ncbi:MAG: cell division protein FtsZ [Patescibacteria group bacterium]
MARLNPDLETFAKIKVVGVGGGGNKAVSRMAADRIKGVEFIAVNTDAQDLHHTQAGQKVHIGRNTTKGLGAGMNPDLGRQAADESREEIQEALKGADLVFVTCGLGGGTGTGAAPVIADIARSQGALTVAVVTKPFSFEGVQRSRIAEEGLGNLRDYVDAMVIIPNDRIFTIIGEETSFMDSFYMVDNVLKQAVQGISDLITLPGIINVDFNDVKAIMENAGSALMGIGIASGEDRAQRAARAAISSPLLELSIEGARGVLFNVSGGSDLGMMEVNHAAKIITDAVDADAKIIFGAVHDPRLRKGEIKLTVIATGFGDGKAPAPKKDPFHKAVSGTQAAGTAQRAPEASSTRQEPSSPRHSQGTSVPVTVAHPPGGKQFAAEVAKISDDGWEVPAFLRRKK